MIIKTTNACYHLQITTQYLVESQGGSNSPSQTPLVYLYALLFED